VGRKLRPLNPAAGPVERFACELRALRAAAGDVPFWKMARRCELSKSALAAAAAGYALPSARVAQQFVEICGGDWPWWRERLVQAHEDLRGAPGRAVLDGPGIVVHPGGALVRSGQVILDAGTGPVPADDAGWRHAAIEPAGGELRRRAGRGRLLAAIAVIEAVAAVLLFVFGFAARSSASPDPRLSFSASAAPPTDGTDPYMAGCGADQQVVEREGMVWPGEGSYGWLTMFHSRRCDASWGSVSGPNSPQWRVVIIAHRPASGASAPSSFSGDSARPGSWGNMLLTTPGCVWVEAYVQTSAGTSRSAKTDCYQAMGPVLHGPTTVRTSPAAKAIQSTPSTRATTGAVAPARAPGVADLSMHPVVFLLGGLRRG
jgi:hypothetical protein